MDFVAAFLNSSDAAIAEAAALALGESHGSAAVEVLQRAWETHPVAILRRSLLAGLALARTDKAFEFLYSQVETAGEKTAAEVIAALAIYSHDERIRTRLAAVVASRQSGTLQEAFNTTFAHP